MSSSVAPLRPAPGNALDSSTSDVSISIEHMQPVAALNARSGVVGYVEQLARQANSNRLLHDSDDESPELALCDSDL